MAALELPVGHLVTDPFELGDDPAAAEADREDIVAGAVRNEEARATKRAEGGIKPGEKAIT